MAHCKDNGLYLRTLATGTELHALKGHKSKVTSQPHTNINNNKIITIPNLITRTQNSTNKNKLR